MKGRSDQKRLADILKAISDIHRYTAEGRKAFDEDELVRTWIVYNLQIIGEASVQLTAGLRAEQPLVWTPLIRLRNTLVHQYDGIDLDIVIIMITLLFAHVSPSFGLQLFLKVNEMVLVVLQVWMAPE